MERKAEERGKSGGEGRGGEKAGRKETETSHLQTPPSQEINHAETSHTWKRVEEDGQKQTPCIPHFRGSSPNPLKFNWDCNQWLQGRKETSLCIWVKSFQFSFYSQCCAALAYFWVFPVACPLISQASKLDFIFTSSFCYWLIQTRLKSCVWWLIFIF